MADSKKYNGSTWEHSLRKLATATDTFTTLPADIYADGNTATVGLKGNTVQSGTPSPENPIMPKGTGERTENLFDYETMRGDTTRYYLDASGNEIQNNFWSITKYIPVDGTVFTLTRTFGGTAPAICLYDSNQNFITGVAYQGEQVVTISSNTNAAYIRFSYFIGELLEDVEHDMLNTGSTPLPYEPYGQYKIPILIGGNTINKYLGEAQTTRQIKKLVFSGGEDESWTSVAIATNDCIFRMDLVDYALSGISPISTHYAGSTADLWRDLGDGSITISIRNTNSVAIHHSGISDVSAWKTYLQQQYANGTPVCVWYVLATPTTGITNEPLMKIGDYADSLTTSIPCTAGENTLDVQTTVAPSEVTAGFSGWHPVQSVHEKSRNLFDKSKRTDNSRVLYTTGEIDALSGTFVSDFTPIEPNTTYTLNIVSSISGKTGHLFALYDENKNFVNTGAHEATAAKVYTFTTPSNVAYIRFNGDMSSVDSTMFNEGSTALPYEPYWK